METDLDCLRAVTKQPAQSATPDPSASGSNLLPNTETGTMPSTAATAGSAPDDSQALKAPRMQVSHVAL